MANLARLDTGNIEVEGLSLDVQAVLRDSPTPFHEQRIVFRRAITGNHMDFSCAVDRFLYEIHVFQHPYIHGSNFSRVMAAQNMIDFIQRRKIIVSSVIAIANSQSLIRMHIEENKFTVGEVVRAHHRWEQQLATQQQKPGSRCL